MTRVSSNGDTVLVTGGAGYIGSHASKALAAAGYTPVVVDDLSRGHAWAVRYGPFVELDLRDRNRLHDVFARYRPASVLHFASLAYVGESVTNPQAYYDVNVGGALALLAAMRAHEVQQIVLSSTCATYGVPERLPIDEQQAQAPINPYGATKLMIERMLGDYAAAYGLRFGALRYFNAAGADEDGELGEVHDPETHLVPLAIAAALGRRDAIDILGTDYPTADGTAIRDFVHVSDLADAHVLALRHLASGGASLQANLGTGSGASVREVVAAVEEVSGRRVPVKHAPRRAGDPPVLVADATRARELLGWTPWRSDLQRIVASALRWQLSRGDVR